MSLDVNATMNAIATSLKTISGLRTYDHPADNVAVPAAIVGYPRQVTYDGAFVRGADSAVFPITLVVGEVSQRTARTKLGAYLAGTGVSSIKAALDGNLGGAAQTARVGAAEVITLTITGVDYVGATFDLEVWA